MASPVSRSPVIRRRTVLRAAVLAPLAAAAPVPDVRSAAAAPPAQPAHRTIIGVI